MIRFLLGFLFLSTCSFSVFAQPDNDDCANAEVLASLTGGCRSYVFADATYDLLNGNCPGISAGDPNIWFSFTAQGMDINIDATTDQAHDPFITIGEFGNPCDLATWNGIDCQTGSLNYSGLTAGNTYYILIADTSTNTQEVELCAENPPDNPAPPNDDPCTPTFISPSGCQSGTTVNATADWSNPNCTGFNEENTVYFQTTLSPGMNELNVVLNNTSITGDVSVMVLEFNPDCNATPIIQTDGFYCGPASNVNFTAINLTENTTYHIFVGTTDAGSGGFQVCLTESGPPPGCSQNDNCNQAEAIGPITSSTENNTQPPTCVTGCNIGGTPDLAIANCINANMSTVYFTFTTDGAAESGFIEITSNDVNGFAAGILLGNCGNLTSIECQSTSTGTLNLTNLGFQANTTYTLILGSNQQATGNFDICIGIFDLPEQCIPANPGPSLTVTGTSMGSPPGGPYQPGETVNFEYYLPSYSATSTIQWLQAIIPIFGEGWDPSSFTAQWEPINSSGPNSAGGATWAWYAEGDNDYNGSTNLYQTYTDQMGRLAMCYWTNPQCSGTPLSPGAPLPAGWYAYQPGGSAGCLNNGDPDYGWGDGLSGPWTVTFSLTARDFPGTEGCYQTGFVDLSVDVITMSDQQVGCWNGGGQNACAGDNITSSSAENSCCEGPIVDPQTDEICSGQQTNIVLTSNQDPDVSFTWVVTQASPNITGYMDGAGKFITQMLTNTGSTAGTVTYSVTGENFNVSCPGTPTDIVVTVYPKPVAETHNDYLGGCAQGTFALGGSPTASGGAGGPYTYNWSGTGLSGPNPSATVNSTTTFFVTVTDQAGCTDVDSIKIVVNEAITIEVTGEDSICANNSPTSITANPQSGSAPYNYAWTTPFGGGNTQTITAPDPGTYTITVTDANNCTGEEEIEVVFHNIPTASILITPVGEDEILCPGDVIDLNANGYGTLDPYTYDWTTPFGSSSNQIITVNDLLYGSYTLTVTDYNGCTGTNEIEVIAASAADPVITGNTVICEGQTTTLTVGSFDSYEWNTIPPQTTPSIDVNTPGFYSVTVTNAEGCEGVDTITVNLDSSVEAEAGPDMVIDCINSTVSLDGSGSSTGMNYSWRAISGNIISGGTTLSPVVDQGGQYELTVTSATGCISLDTVEVIETTDLPTADAGPDQLIDCQNSDATLDGSASDTGPGYSVMWHGDASQSISDPTEPVITVTESGTYTIVIENTSTGCRDSASATVTVDTVQPIADIDATQDLSCTADTVILDGSASTSGNNIVYQWTPSNDIIGDPATAVVSTETAGDYTLTVIDNNNSCRDSATVTVTDIKDIPVAEITPPSVITCDSPQIILDGSNSSQGNQYVYQWNTPTGGIVSGQGTPQVTINQPGSYTLIVTDTTNSCEESVSVMVNQNNNPPFATVATDTAVLTCTQSSLILDGTGSQTGAAISYNWSSVNGNILNGQTTLMPEVDAAGIYVLTVTNANNGCSSTAEAVVVIDEDVPVANVGVPDTIDCNNSSITLDGTSSSTGAIFSYQWTGGNIVSGSTSLTPIVGAPGTYTLEVTNTTNGCEAISNVTIGIDTVLPAINIIQPGDITCYDPQLTIDASGSAAGPDITYNWTAGAGGNIVGAPDTPAVTVDAPGTYTLVVNDLSSGCISSEQINVSLDQQDPVIDIVTPEAITCEMSEITIDASGSSSGNRLTYVWTTVDGAILSGENSLTPVAASGGTYTLTITDTVNGCFSTQNVVVPVDADFPDVSAQVYDEITCDSTMVTLDGTGSETGNSVIYQWTTNNGNIISGNNTLFPVVSEPGVYNLMVSDTSTGCADVASVTVNIDTTSPDIEPVSDRIINCGDSTAQLAVVVNGSTADLEFLWTTSTGNITSDPTMDNITVNEEGIYTVNVINTLNGCVSTETGVITLDEDAPTADAGTDDTLNCSVAQLTLGGNSSTGPDITYQWSGTGNILTDPSLATIEVNSSGTYNLIVTDNANGCTAQSTVTVDEDYVEPTVNIAPPAMLDCQVQTLVLDASGSSQGNEFTYAWSTSEGDIVSGESTLSPEVSQAGIYILTVTDNSNGCTATASVEVMIDSDVPEVEIATPAVLTCDVDQVVLDGSASSAGAQISYMWSTQGGIISGDVTSAIVMAEAPGTYTLELFDASNNCTKTASVTVQEDVTSPDVEAGEPQELTCQVTEVSLNGSSAGNVDFEWTTNNGSIISGENTSSPVVSEIGLYILTVTDRDNGCTATDEVEVFANDDVVSDLLLDVEQTLCEENSLGCIRINSVDGGIAPFSYFVNDDPVTQTEFCDLQPGMYTLRVEDSNGCSFEKTVELEEPDPLDVSLDETLEIAWGDSTMQIIEVSTNRDKDDIVSILWSADDVIFDPEDCDTCHTIGAFINNTTLIHVRVTDDAGCIDEAIMSVFVRKDFGVYIPNVFNPNSSNPQNSTLAVYGDPDKVAMVDELIVFNRWGDQVFYRVEFPPNDPAYGWNGIFNGEAANVGVYVYKAVVRFWDGSTEVYHGDVTLIR